MHVRQETRESDGPETEIRDGAPDGSGRGRAEVFEDGAQESEMLLTGLIGGQELFGDFGEKIESAGRGKIVEYGKLRLDEFAGIDIDEFAILSLVVRQSDLLKPF
jgi:hypothetical protein